MNTGPKRIVVGCGQTALCWYCKNGHSTVHDKKKSGISAASDSLQLQHLRLDGKDITVTRFRKACHEGTLLPTLTLHY